MASVAGYAIVTAVVNLYRHGTQSASAIFATVVMLLVLNGFLLVVSTLNLAIQALEQKVNVIAYLKDDVDDETGEALRDRIGTVGSVVETDYLSRAAAMARLREQLADRAELLNMVSAIPCQRASRCGFGTPQKCERLPRSFVPSSPSTKLRCQKMPLTALSG